MAKKKVEAKVASDSELLKCKIQSDGELVCKVSKEEYDKVRKGPIVKKVTFEVQAEEKA